MLAEMHRRNGLQSNAPTRNEMINDDRDKRTVRSVEFEFSLLKSFVHAHTFFGIAHREWNGPWYWLYCLESISEFTVAHVFALD